MSGLDLCLTKPRAQIGEFAICGLIGTFVWPPPDEATPKKARS